MSSNSLPLLKCLHSTHSLKETNKQKKDIRISACFTCADAVSSSLCADPLLHGAGIRAGGTLVTRGPVGSWLGALTGPAHTLAPPAAQQAQVGHAGVGASGAVAVLALPVGRALAEATVTDAVA